MKAAYVTAVTNLLTTGSEPESILRGLKQTLETRGHTQLYRPVLEETARVLAERSKKQAPKLTLARTSDETKLAATIADAMRTLGVSENPIPRVDDSIIGGFKLEHNHRQLDQSYKTALLTLYRAITN